MTCLKKQFWKGAEREDFRLPFNEAAKGNLSLVKLAVVKKLKSETCLKRSSSLK